MPRQTATAQPSAQIGDPRVNAALAAERATDRAEREENSNINDAVRATEQEIFDEALGSDPLDLDGDTSLEEMGEGLEGDDLPDDEEGETDEGADEDDEGPGVPPGHTTRPRDARGEDQDDDEDLGDQVDDRGQQQQPQPERRDQRGALREERGRRREATAAYDELQDRYEREMGEMRGRIDALTQVTARGPQPQPQQQQEQPDPEPDFLTYPDQWKDWNTRNAQKIARSEVQRSMSEFERRNVERSFQGLDEHMADAANGPRSYEFHEAYARLQRDHRNPDNQQLVNRMLRSADPMKLLWSWWERNGGPEYRDQVARDLADQLGYELPDDFPEPPPRRVVGRDGRYGAPRQQRTADSSPADRR